jgi:hypothetical protein
MKKFCFVLVGLMFLTIPTNMFNVATAAEPQQHRGTPAKRVKGKSALAGKHVKRKPAKKKIASKGHIKGKQTKKSRSSGTCTSKNIVNVAKGSKFS